MRSTSSNLSPSLRLTSLATNSSRLSIRDSALLSRFSSLAVQHSVGQCHVVKKMKSKRECVYIYVCVKGWPSEMNKKETN